MFHLISYKYGMKKAIEDEEYVKWMFLLGEYYRVRETNTI
jgi:hypothetical protein